MNAPVVVAENLTRHYPIKGGLFGKNQTVRALSETSFTLAPGKTLAVVGESGCGKSTLGRMVAGIMPPSDGSIVFGGTDIAAMDAEGPLMAGIHALGMAERSPLALHREHARQHP